jgi:glycosyltransferase involved in cell wall biosynthesis
MADERSGVRIPEGGVSSLALKKASTPTRTERLSLIIPVYKNEDNIPALVSALQTMDASLDHRLEVVFVVDGSPDLSGQALLTAQPDFTFRSKVVFHSRNFGSFTAIRTGLELATGDYFAAMAADLQEPPELILSFFETLESDQADVVFGQRTGRDDSILQRALSNAFWWMFERLVVRHIPKGGVDVFACNQAVREVLLTIREPNSSLVAQLFWVGFRRGFVPYRRQEREVGKSAWKLSSRVRYMMDSIVSYTDLPILIVLWVGTIGCIGSILYGLFLLGARFFGVIEQPGYVSLVLLIIFFGSASLSVQGLLGCYLWRTFENTKQRPLRIVSRVVEGASQD